MFLDFAVKLCAFSFNNVFLRVPLKNIVIFAGSIKTYCYFNVFCVKLVLVPSQSLCITNGFPTEQIKFSVVSCFLPVAGTPGLVHRIGHGLMRMGGRT